MSKQKSPYKALTKGKFLNNRLRKISTFNKFDNFKLFDNVINRNSALSFSSGNLNQIKISNLMKL